MQRLRDVCPIQAKGGDAEDEACRLQNFKFLFVKGNAQADSGKTGHDDLKDLPEELHRRLLSTGAIGTRRASDCARTQLPLHSELARPPSNPIDKHAARCSAAASS